MRRLFNPLRGSHFVEQHSQFPYNAAARNEDESLVINGLGSKARRQ